MSLIAEAADLLDSSGLAAFNEQKGCSQAEIANLEKDSGARLPDSYKEFLSLMGKQCGTFFVGTDFLYPKPLQFRKGAENLLRECNSTFRLPQTAFVFLFHQGYQFLFFNVTSVLLDPPVFRFGDDVTEPHQVAASFADWFTSAVDDDIAANADSQ